MDWAAWLMVTLSRRAIKSITSRQIPFVQCRHNHMFLAGCTLNLSTPPQNGHGPANSPPPEDATRFIPSTKSMIWILFFNPSNPMITPLITSPFLVSSFPPLIGGENWKTEYLSGCVFRKTAENTGKLGNGQCINTGIFGPNGHVYFIPGNHAFDVI